MYTGQTSIFSDQLYSQNNRNMEIPVTEAKEKEYKNLNFIGTTSKGNLYNVIIHGNQI